MDMSMYVSIMKSMQRTSPNMKESEYQKDIDVILAHRYDQGHDLWTTPDQRLCKGSPFSTLDCISYLLELGMDKEDIILKQCADLIYQHQKKDGRFSIAPNGGIYPCHTALCANTLRSLGFIDDERIQKTLLYFLHTQEKDGGWKCNKYSFGRGEETIYSTPYTTLVVLDLFHESTHCNTNPALDQAVEFLLQHWEIKKPISPCHYGIGTLFHQLEYPFRGYNIFYYVYVLSYYSYARKDPRFLQALDIITSKLTKDGLIVERCVPKLAKLHFCRKNVVSKLATKRYEEIMDRMKIT